MTRRFFATVHWGLWLLLLALLPVTSLPLVSKISGSSQVAPASGAVLVVLVLVWFIPYLLRGGPLPFQALPLAAFAGAVILSCAAAFFAPVPPFRDLSIRNSEVKALVTLGVGLLFFLTVSVWVDSELKLRFALRVINWSGLVMILWSLVQGYFWWKSRSYPQWMWDIQEALSGSRLYESRVTGFALEPSWLAHQLNMLYLPFWLAATIRGHTSHAIRLWKFTFENLLLVAGLAVLYLSLSRVGLLAFLLMIALLILFANIRMIRWMQARISGARDSSHPSLRLKQLALSAGLALALLLIYIGLLLGVGFSLSKIDYRMARLFDLQFLRDTSFIKYANQLVIAERLVFWQAGWDVFNTHPLLGVGLGNAGFYFNQTMSAFGWALTEVRTVLYYGSALPNIKSIWVRLLAETGLLGFSLFLSWCYVLWQSARGLRSAASRLMQVAGWAGSFVLVGLLVEGFSVDTFALPYFWVSLGLLAAASRLSFLCPPASEHAQPAGRL